MILSMLAAAALAAAPVSAADSCDDPAFRTKVILEASQADGLSMALVIRDLYEEERKQPDSPCRDMSVNLTRYIEETYVNIVDFAKAKNVLATRDYKQFIKVFRRYRQVPLSDKEITAYLNEGGILFAPADLAQAYLDYLDTLLAKLDDEDRRRKGLIFERMDRLICAQVAPELHSYSFNEE